MKVPVWLLHILSGCLLLTGRQTPLAAALFPGVTLYEYPGNFEGRLAFLLATSESTSAPAIIYTLDLKSRNLREVACAPKYGIFTVSRDGKVFCVRDGEDDLKDPQAFLYSDRLQTSRVVPLPRGPRADAFVGDHVFFEIPGTNVSNLSGRLLQYDVSSGTMKYLKMPGTNAWENESFGQPWSAEQATNLLYFQYWAHREPRRDPRNSRSGIFSYNVSSGAIEPAPRMHGRPFVNIGADGRYIFFDGPGAPAGGRNLISSPVDYSDLDDVDARTRRGVKVLKRFPYQRLGHYWLLQLSPDKKYAFVQHGECLKTGSMGTWVYTYYAVDLTDGKTWPLLKNEFELKTGRRMFQQVYWVNP